MKATGIVRRLDDLGRLVIPKEIRKIYRLKEGDSIEFFVSDNNEVILRKYEHLTESDTDIRVMIEIFQDTFKKPVMFYGDDRLIAVHEYMVDRTLSDECLRRIQTYHDETIGAIKVFQEDEAILAISVFPLVVDSHWVGSFILTDDHPSEAMKALLHGFVRFLSYQMTE